MKGMELFDMLGEIDDKFFEEAAPPDTQQPLEITAEKRSLKHTLLSIVMPVAACIAIVAAIGIGIGYLGQNVFMQPNISLSEYTAFDKENTQDVQSRVILDTKEFDDCKVLLLAHDVSNEYLELLIAGPQNHVYHQIRYSRLFVVLEKDGKAVAQSDDLDIEHLDFDSLSEYIQPFDLKDGKGFVLYSYIISEKRGNARFYSIDGDKMIQLKNTRPPEPEEEVEIKPNFTVNYENDTLISGDSIISINFSNRSYRITEKIDLDDYRDFNQTNTELQPKVIFEVWELKDYRIYLLGHDARISASEDRATVGCSRLLLALEKNGEVFDTINVENMALISGNSTNRVQPFEMKDGIGIAMFYRFDPGDMQEPYVMLYKIDNDMIIKLKSESQPDYVSNTQHYVAWNSAVAPEINAILTGSRTMTVNFADNSYTSEETDLSAEYLNLEEYLPYDRNSTKLQPKVVFDVKEMGDYRIYLLGNGVQTINYAGVADAVRSSIVYTAVEKDGEFISIMSSINEYLAPDCLGGYIRPFELKDGVGYLFYACIESWRNSLPVCVACIIKDDQLIDICQDRFMDLKPDFKIAADENALYDDKVKITIDFINNTFIEQ